MLPLEPYKRRCKRRDCSTGFLACCSTEVKLPTGQIARVVEVGEDGSFKIDANHRLAGKALTFDIELLDCIEPKLLSDSGFSLEKMPLEQQIMEAKAAELPPMSMNVIFNHGTEPPFTGKTIDGTSHDCKLPGEPPITPRSQMVLAIRQHHGNLLSTTSNVS